MKKVLKSIIKLGSIISIIGVALYFREKQLKNKYNNSERYRVYYSIVNEWIANKNAGKKFENYFKEYQYKKIVIYGTGTMAENFYNEIKESDIQVACFVDRNAGKMNDYKDNIKILSIESLLKFNDYDVIVVTPIYDYDNIVLDLNNAGINKAIVSLEDVILGV